MERNEKTSKAAVIAVILLVIAIAANFFVAKQFKGVKETESAPMSEFWTEGSEPAQALRDYVAKVTDPSDKENFIPEKDRIAVFDMDGTLVCETYYTYYDTMMFIEFCLHDHPERVSNELKEIAAAIKPGYVADESLARNFAKAYAGMTVEEFSDYVVEFGQRPVLAFGNSGSDTSMMNYAIDSRNPYPAQAYMVVADDDVREWGTQNWEEKSAGYAAKGFIPISMKNDFSRIYPEEITKAEQQYVPAESEDEEEELATAA